MTGSARPTGVCPTGVCRACRAARGADDTVLDLGDLPPSDLFPTPGDPGPDPLFALSMWLCRACGLAQLTEDPTHADEPRAVEPEALRRQAADGVAGVLAWPGVTSVSRTVTEFGSPHGGSWLGLFAGEGWRAVDDRPAGLVVDCFGLMHEPDQRAALRERVDRLEAGGVLLLLFHSLEAILGHRQWSSLRHGHFAYWSTNALCRLLSDAGLEPECAWEFGLYGGTVLLAARRTEAHAGPEHEVDASVSRILAREVEAGLTDVARVRALQRAADEESAQLAAALDERRPVHAYGAASRAVSVLVRGGATPATVAAVADASPAKQGRCLPGSRIPIISPAELVRRDPERVWLLLPDLLAEVSAALPELAGRWTTGTAPDG